MTPDPFTQNASLSVVHIYLNPWWVMLSLFAITMAGSAAALDTREPPIELVHIASPAIFVDGMLEEEEWQGLPEFKNFVKLSPATLEQAPFDTRTKMFYSDEGIYIGIQADQPSDSLIERLSSRDQFITRDGFSIILDPSGEGLYAYWFAINLGNSVGDGMVLPERQFSRQWDGPWYGATARNDSGYAAEYYLPFSMLAMPGLDEIERTMGLYIMRRVGFKSEFWGWPALPDTQPKFLSALQPIILDNFKPRRQFTFYPYAAIEFDVIENAEDLKSGFDIFWRPSSNLQLMAAVKPDFGNIESDDVVVNLTAIETFFPEKRPLFLEGQEIFTTSPRAQSRGRGTPTILVNTRRIGSPLDVPTIDNFEVSDVEANQLTELIAAAKVTGQKNGWRYGLLTAIEDDTIIKGHINNQEVGLKADGRTFGAARLLYESTAGGIRRGLGWITTMVSLPSGDAKVHGLDGHFLSADGSWNIDGQLLYSDVNNATGLGGFADITYAPTHGHKHRVALNYFDEDLDINDFGFTRRNDAITARYHYELTQSDLPGLKERETSLTLSQEYNTNGLVVRSGIFFSQEREFANNTELTTELNYFPARWDDLSSRKNGSFRLKPRWQAGASWDSDSAKSFHASLGYSLKDDDLHKRHSEKLRNQTQLATER